jgi:hypothetical protein
MMYSPWVMEGHGECADTSHCNSIAISPSFFNQVTLCVLCHEILSGMDLYGKEFP